MSQDVLTLGSLFSGIGGLELGLEMTGRFRTVWQVEQDEYCRKVLARHWPDAQRFEDVRNVGKENLSPVDVICGGFPCQPHSQAGKGQGEADERYLWPEYARIVCELRPRFVVVENVANILADGTALRVLGDLAALGFDAEWSVVSACAVGAPHTRERLFLVAYADRCNGSPRLRNQLRAGLRPNESRDDGAVQRPGTSSWLDDPSALYRDANGLPDRVVRGHALGNAVVPQCAQVIGEWLLEIDAALTAEERAS